MVMNIKHTFILLLAILACSCTKDTDEVGAPILFSIDGGLDVELTKSAINADNLAFNTIKVYAEKDASAITDAKTAIISKPNSYWNYSNNMTWDDGHAYSFRGYAYSTAGFSSIADNGLTFTVQQSTSYNDANLRDFIISSRVVVSAEESRRHPVVSLEFDHVLPAIQVYVTRSENIRTAKVTKITLSNLFSKATMRYSEKDDIWTTEIDASNKRTASYSVSNAGFYVGTDKSSTDAMMNIISVPQVFDETTELIITYKVDERAKDTDKEKLVPHTQEFRLIDYVPEIRSGYRTILHANIDTGIHLSAGIVKWKQVDFIEGTVLPPIDRPQEDPPQSD